VTESLKVTACADHGRIMEVSVQPFLEGRWAWGEKVYQSVCPGVPLPKDGGLDDDPTAWLASLTDSPVTCELVTHRFLIPESVEGTHEPY
jgi:hypothetical protein